MNCGVKFILTIVSYLFGMTVCSSLVIMS